MDPKTWLASLLLSATSFYGYTQKNTFSLGGKVGIGASALPLNAELTANGVTRGVRPMTVFSTGILAQYMIGDFMGIESGTHLTHYGYFLNKNSVWQNLFREDPIIEVFNYQIPVVLLCKIKMPSDPFTSVKLAGGTSVDWLTTDGVTKWGNVVSLNTLYGALRICREKARSRRIEYGLEFQYSFKRFFLKGVNYDQVEESLSSRLSLLNLNFYFFFWNKPLTRPPEDKDTTP
jgi:hypothetical protein